MDGQFEASVPSDYALSLLTSLHVQQKAKDFCDVTLVLCTQKFWAHKNVLAAASPYFHAMFTGGLVECTQNEVQLQGTSPAIFDMLINFMYTGNINITEETCQDLLMAADLFGLSPILKECCHFLQKQIDPTNCLGIYKLADAHSCTNLKKFVKDYICTHFLEVCKGEEYLSLDKETLNHFLSNEQLCIEKEAQVFSAALRWISHDLRTRRTLVFEIMCSVRFPLISKIVLDKYIEECHDLGTKIAVRKIAQDFHEPMRLHYVQLEKLRKTKPFLFQEREGVRRTIMIVGGYSRVEGTQWRDSETLCSAELFDTYRMSWKAVPHLKYSRSAHGTVVLNGLVYVIGGESDSMIFDNVECYDPAMSKWLPAPSMTIPRCALGAAVIDGCIYAIGGWVGSEIGLTMEKFDPQCNVWVQIGKMPTPRISMGVVSYEGLIYVIGGIGESNVEETCVESYDPVTRRWCKLASLITPRAYVATCAADEFIYAIGGTSNTEEATLATVERYDIQLDKWTILTEMKTARAGAAAVYLSNMLYVFGGRTKSKGFSDTYYTMDSVDCYDLGTKSWFVVDCLNTGRCDAGLVIL